MNFFQVVNIGLWNTNFCQNSQYSPWVSFIEWWSVVHFLLFAFLIHFPSLQVKVTLNTSSASYYWLCSFGKINLSSVGDCTSIRSILQGRNTTQWRAWSHWLPYWLSWSTLSPSLSLSLDLFWQTPSFSTQWIQCLNTQICTSIEFWETFNPPTVLMCITHWVSQKYVLFFLVITIIVCVDLTTCWTVTLTRHSVSIQLAL